MSIQSDLLRGSTDTIILSLLSKEDCYGYRVNQIVSAKTDDKFGFKEATLYSAFKRLEKGELISSYWGDEGAGARRKYYKITESGLAKLDQLRTDYNEIKTYIDILIREETNE